MKIRPTTVDDAEAIAHVRVVTWQHAYRGLLPDELLDALDEAAIAHRWRTVVLPNPSPTTFGFVAEDENARVCAFTGGGPERTNDPEYSGEIYALYVLPGQQRRGIGQALVAAGVQSLLSLGYHSMLIWVLSQNHNAHRFYEKTGGQPVRQQKIEIGGALYPETGYGWKDIRQWQK